MIAVFSAFIGLYVLIGGLLCGIAVRRSPALRLADLGFVVFHSSVWAWHVAALLVDEEVVPVVRRKGDG